MADSHEKRLPEVLGAGAVLYRHGPGGVIEFLLLRNARHGTWAPPKGHLESGESPSAGARRELIEEVGPGARALFVDGFEEAVAYPVQEGGRTGFKRVTYFLARLEGGEIALSAEHDDLLWADLDRSLARLAHEGVREILRRAATFVGRQR